MVNCPHFGPLPSRGKEPLSLPEVGFELCKYRCPLGEGQDGGGAPLLACPPTPTLPHKGGRENSVGSHFAMRRYRCPEGEGTVELVMRICAQMSIYEFFPGNRHARTRLATPTKGDRTAIDDGGTSVPPAL